MATRKRHRDPEAAESSSVLLMPSEEGDQEYDKFVRRDDQTLWEWLAQFNSDDWRHLIVYVWRTMPKIDLKANGRPINIGKISEPFDVEWIKRNYGSGGYRMDFSYIPTVGKQTRICQEYFEVHDPLFPPMVEYGDWVEYPDNKNWIWGAKRPDDPATAPASPVVQARDGAGLLRDAISVVKELRGEGNKEAEGFMLKMLESNRELIERMDPMKQMQTFKLWADMLKPAEKSDDKFSEFLLEEMREQRRETARLREQLLTQHTAAPHKSDIDSLLENGEKLEKLAGAFGFKRGSGRAAQPEEVKPIWMDFATKAFESLAPVAEAAAKYFFSPKPQPQAQPQHRTMIDATASTVNGGTVQQTPQSQQADMLTWLKENEKLFMSCAPFMLDEFNAGTPGQNFRDWFIDRKGFEKWREFKSKLGAEGLADLLSQNSYFADMNPRDRVIKWLTQVFEDPKPEDLKDEHDDDDDQSDDEANAQPTLK